MNEAPPLAAKEPHQSTDRVMLFDAKSLREKTGHIPAFAARGDGLILTEESLAICEKIGAAEKALGFGALTVRSRRDHSDGCDCMRCLNLKRLRARELIRRVDVLRARLGVGDFKADWTLLPLEALEAEYEACIAHYASKAA